MAKSIKVRLKVDLTKYIPNLVEGSEGYTVPNGGIWSRASDRFVGVKFPSKGTLDVLWDSLEIIDEEYLAEIEKREQRFLEELKTAYDVVKYIGPRGGFKYLTYTYIDSKGIKISTSQGFKNEAEKLIKIFDKYGIEVFEKIIN